MKRFIAFVFTWFSIAFAIGVAAVSLSGCGAAPCTTERSVVAGLSLTLELARASVPESPEATQALALADESISLGGHLVDSCEIADSDPSAWTAWLGNARDLVGDVLDIIEAAGVSLPIARAAAPCVCPVEEP